jgi:hypothetical protein
MTIMSRIFYYDVGNDASYHMTERVVAMAGYVTKWNVTGNLWVGLPRKFLYCCIHRMVFILRAISAYLYFSEPMFFTPWFQHVDEENSYLCGYLKIKGLTDEFPTLTTFFDGEIISKKYPFLTRKWDADEDVDRKHWVSAGLLPYLFLL